MSLSMPPSLRRVLPRRFVVADRSMEPTLVDGQGLIGVRRSRVRVGQLRAFEHPDRPDFWLVKRVASVSGDSMIVESDNRDIPTIDSNTFGPVDGAGSYRIVVRVPRRWM
jgi:hypothetical protein